MRIRLLRERLVELIGLSGLTQNHWAIRLGLSRGHFSDLINGKYPYPSARTRERLLERFNVTFDDLFAIEVDNDSWTDSSRAAFQSAISDRYVVDREVGQGGMGTVYLARDVRHGRQVAIKVVSPEAVSGVGARQFLKEIRAAASLLHPHILTLFDSGEAAGYPYYVMPFVPGGSLREAVSRFGRFDLDWTLRVVEEVGDALDHAHRQRRLHCDVKPENILLTDNHAYLADFGISKALHAEVMATVRRGDLDSSAGTPGYVSPEQALGGSVLDGRSDQYSLACVAFELLCGLPPFTGTTTVQTVSRRFTDRIPEVREHAPNVPVSVSDVIRRAMDVEPQRRFPTTADFVRALTEARQTRHVGHRIVEGLGRIVTPLRTGSLGTGISRILRGFDGVGHDLTFAWRMFRTSPGFVLVVVLTLGLGVGANTAMFSLINGVLLRSLPYPDPDQLVVLQEEDAAGRASSASYLNFADWRAQSELLTGVAAMTGVQRTTVLGGAEAVRAPVLLVTTDFFEVMGVQPHLGRWIAPDENAEGARPVAVVSYSFWQQSLGAPSDLRDVTLRVGLDVYYRTGAEVFDVVGVMPPGFAPLGAADLWLPLERHVPWNVRGNHVVRVVGRLDPEATLTSGDTELDGVARRIQAAYPGDTEAVGVRVTSLKEWTVVGSRRLLWTLMGASAVLLLVACTNLASALLARGVNRRHELAIRSSLGAARWRLIRQLFAENVLLSLFGGVVGVMFAVGILKGLAIINPGAIPRMDTVGLDPRALSFAVFVTALSALLFGLAPGLPLTTTRPGSALTSGSLRTTAGGKRALWGVLVGGQIAATLVLLMGAGLLLRSFWRIASQDLGFESEGVVTARISVPAATYPNPDDAAAFFERLLESLNAIPGIDRAGAVNFLPTFSGSYIGPIELERGIRHDGPMAHYRLADRDYFAALAIPLIEGRTFEATDAPGSPHAVVINQSMARQVWPGESAVGKRFHLGGMDPYRDDWLYVVGVVAEARDWRSEPGTQVSYYINYRQRPFAARSMTVVVRSRLSYQETSDLVRQHVRTLDPDVPADVRRLTDYLADSVADRRFTLLSLGAFAFVAILLSATGTYGVVSYSVAQRRREMGIRLALGATPQVLRRLVLWDAGRIVLSGLMIGGVFAVAFAQLIRSQLFDVSARDPVVLLSAIILLGGVGIAASYLPARRTSTASPLQAMRVE